MSFIDERIAKTLVGVCATNQMKVGLGHKEGYIFTDSCGRDLSKDVFLALSPLAPS